MGSLDHLWLHFTEMGEAAAAQMRELPFAINWTFAHPRSIELAGEVAALAPGDLNRVLFVSGGSEAVEPPTPPRRRRRWPLRRSSPPARLRSPASTPPPSTPP